MGSLASQLIQLCQYICRNKMASDERELLRVPGACAECRRDYEKKQFSDPWCCFPDEELVLWKASKDGHLDCVKACLAAGADVREEWIRRLSSFGIHSPLYKAVEHSKEDCVECLIEAGAEIYNRLLLVTGKRGNERCVRLIL